MSDFYRSRKWIVVGFLGMQEYIDGAKMDYLNEAIEFDELSDFVALFNEKKMDFQDAYTYMLTFGNPNLEDEEISFLVENGITNIAHFLN